MAIISIFTEAAGQSGVNPRLVKINCNDVISTVTAPGYLSPTNQETFPFYPTDLILVSYNGGTGFFTPKINGNIVTLQVGHTYGNNYIYSSYTDGIVAHAGGGQSAATLLTSSLNRVTTVATAGDSILLPWALPGLQLIVTNAAANSCNVFPSTGGQINTLAVNTAFALAGGKTVMFVSMSTAQWYSILSA